LASTGACGRPAYYNGKFIYGGALSNVRAFNVANASFSISSISSNTIGALDGTISVSSNALTNGLAWLIDRADNTLKMYDATNVTSVIWSSSMAPGARDQ